MIDYCGRCKRQQDFAFMGRDRWGRPKFRCTGCNEKFVKVK